MTWRDAWGKRPTYGFDIARLAQHYSVDDLISLDQAIKNDPVMRMPGHSVFLYKPRARKMLDAIGYAIYNIQKAKAA